LLVFRSSPLVALHSVSQLRLGFFELLRGFRLPSLGRSNCLAQFGALA
jgi:hypothetical protein